MISNKSPIEEYAESCEKELLKRVIQIYAHHKYEGKEVVVNHLTTLFAAILEEELDAKDGD